MFRPGIINYSSNVTLGLIAWWKFDEGMGSVAYDTTSNHYDGTLSDATKWDVGKIGPYSALFSGANSIQVDQVAGVFPPYIGSPFSIALWLLDDTIPTTLHATYHRIVAWTYSNTYQLGLAADTDQSDRCIYFINTDGVSKVPNIVSGSLSTGWHHIVVTNDGAGNYTLYIDGISNSGGGTSDIINTWFGDTTHIFIGQRGNGGYVTGNIDDARMYNRVLTSDEAYQLYSFT